MIAANEIDVVEAGEGAMTEVLALRRIVFPGEELDKQDPRYFRWAFADGRHGAARFYLAYDRRGKLLGSYTVLPQRFAAPGGDLLGSIVVDVMTHPEARMRGVFTALGRAAMAANAAHGIAFACGYPVRQEVMPGHLKVGWRELFTIRVLIRPLETAVMLARHMPSPIARLLGNGAEQALSTLAAPSEGELEIQDAGIAVPGTFDALGAELDALWNLARERAQIQQVRDRPYLEWRYGRHPTRTYRVWTARVRGDLTAVVVTVAREIRGLRTHAIADMITRNDEPGDAALAGLLGDIERTLRREHAGDVLIALGTANGKERRVLARAGFLPAPRAILHFIVHEARAVIPRDLFSRSDSWSLFWGDTDDV